MTIHRTTEIIAIGSELLLGDTVDTNSAHLARTMRGIGFHLRFISAVGDDESLIAEAIVRGLARSEVVLTTGGLGPTVDDKTRSAIAQATGRSLVFHPELLEQIQARFAQMGSRMSDNNRQQAYIPDGAFPIENPVGTAPCFVGEQGASCVICLPGVPSEMIYLLENQVVPYLRRRFPLTSVIKTRVLHTVGLGESVVDSKISDLESLTNPVIGLAAYSGLVDVRLTARAVDEAAVERLLAQAESTVRERLGDAIFGVDAVSLEQVVLDWLGATDQTVSTIEGGTRGQLAERLVQADGGRGIFRSGILRPSLVSANGLETALAQMLDYCFATFNTNFALACNVVKSEGAVELGTAIGEARTESRRTQVRSLRIHPDHAGQWGASLCLNLLRTRQPSQQDD